MPQEGSGHWGGFPSSSLDMSPYSGCMPNPDSLFCKNKPSQPWSCNIAEGRPHLASAEGFQSSCWIRYLRAPGRNIRSHPQVLLGGTDDSDCSRLRECLITPSSQNSDFSLLFWVRKCQHWLSSGCLAHLAHACVSAVCWGFSLPGTQFFVNSDPRPSPGWRRALHSHRVFPTPTQQSPCPLAALPGLRDPPSWEVFLCQTYTHDRNVQSHLPWEHP